MSAGGIVAVGFWGAFLALCLYHGSHDLRRWLQGRALERPRPQRDLRFEARYAAMLQRADIELAGELPTTLECPEEERQ